MWLVLFLFVMVFGWIFKIMFLLMLFVSLLVVNGMVVVVLLVSVILVVISLLVEIILVGNRFMDGDFMKLVINMFVGLL